jgi:hypothetical protein
MYIIIIKKEKETIMKAKRESLIKKFNNLTKERIYAESRHDFHLVGHLDEVRVNLIKQIDAIEI